MIVTCICWVWQSHYYVNVWFGGSWAISCWGIVHLSKIYWHNHVVMTFVTHEVCIESSTSLLLSKIHKESSQLLTNSDILQQIEVVQQCNNIIFHLTSWGCSQLILLLFYSLDKFKLLVGCFDGLDLKIRKAKRLSVRKMAWIS